MNSKHAFWQALVFTIVIFGIGLILGFFLESYRADEVEFNLLDSETNLLDDQIRDRIIEEFDINCEIATESTFDFADKIYREAEQLEKYDAASKITDSLLTLHRRYDLLRALLWTESVALKAECDENFHTIVYLYEYAAEDVDIKSRQRFYSLLLLDLKNKYSDKILLIPIAANSNLESIDLLVEKYGIDELPSIIIDEKKIVDEVITLEELEGLVFEKSYDKPNEAITGL